MVAGTDKGELVNLAGKMTIKIDDGKHYYEFDYSVR